MQTLKHHSRRSGILAHITSLPSPFGIGDMGSGTLDFLKFLARGGQSILQVLPLGPTHSAFSHSPYMTVSAFAGNPLIISPELLHEEGYLKRDEVQNVPEFSPYRVDFAKVSTFKQRLLQRAYSRFIAEQEPDYQDFIAHNSWLDDYCLFMALKTSEPDKAWYEWEPNLASREKAALKQAREQFHHEIGYHRFEQFIFARQWQNLRKQAAELGIRLFGDIPIYVSLDSADVWANQSLFQLDPQTRRPTHVAGVPPDYFSDTGQKWGNPLYRWNSDDPDVEEALLNWWTARFTTVFAQVDIARIDHFRGFQAYWTVPAEHETALEGWWQPGPQAAFFEEIFHRLGPLDIVAEDLGEITEDVVELREKLGFPGMKILQFAFDDNLDNSFLPFNFESSNFVIYTGTHDNNTTVGWYLSDRIGEDIRRRVSLTANRNHHDAHGVHRDFIYLAMASIADTSIYPLQDVLGFGEDCRMNMPGTSTDNWTWRCKQEFLTGEIESWLLAMTETFNRKPQPLPEQKAPGQPDPDYSSGESPETKS